MLNNIIQTDNAKKVKSLLGNILTSVINLDEEKRPKKHITVIAIFSIVIYFFNKFMTFMA